MYSTDQYSFNQIILLLDDEEFALGQHTVGTEISLLILAVHRLVPRQGHPEALPHQILLGLVCFFPRTYTFSITVMLYCQLSDAGIARANL